MAYQKNRRISYLVVILLFGVLVGLPAVNANVPDANAFAIGTNTPPALAGVAANNIVFLPALGKAGAPAPTSTSTRTPTPNGPTPTTSPSTNEWPMLAANPQRTSWSPEEVRGALNVAWYRPIEPYIPYKVQPIAAVGKIFVSTAKGLYAFSASNGSLAWVYPTELPLGHSPTVATVNSKSVAYVGGYDHLIHAVDTQTGAMLAGYTPYEAGAGFETNPLVIGNTIYAGNRDGYFYALDAATGSLKWRYQTGAEIRFSAAYKNGILYFASNDSYAYALNTSGGLVWKSAKLLGQGFYSYWPVIYTNRATGKDYLVLATGENYRFQDLSPVGNYSPGLVGVEIEAFLAGTPFNNVFGSTGTVSGDWSSGTVTLDASRITTYYENNPHRRTTFILDNTNGQEYTFDSNGNGKPEYAPFSWSGVTHGGTRYPAIVNGIDGVLYQQTAYFNGGWASRGAPVGWKFGTQYISLIAPQNVELQGTTASDESSAFSAGGRMVFHSLCCDRLADGVDISIPINSSSGRSWRYFGYSLNSTAPDYDTMYNDGTASYTDINGFQEYSGNTLNTNGIYGKHGTDQSPAIPYQGKLYFLRGNSLIAYSSSGGAVKLPLATTVNAPSANIHITKANVNARLESEIQKMLAAGHLRPGYIAHGIIDQWGAGQKTNDAEYGELFDYWQNPSETVVTLIQALPYLSANTQTQVKNYIKNNYGPGAPYDFASIVHVGWNTGAAREPFIIPNDVLSKYTSFGKRTTPICASCGYWQRFPPYSFYAAWKYAQVFGGAAALYNSMSGKLEAPLSDATFQLKPHWLNQYLAGYQGFLELRKLAGLADDATVRGYYNHLLTLRTNGFSKDWPVAITYQEDPKRGIGVMRNFLYTTPEIGDAMQGIKSRVQTAVNEYTYLAPYWFVSKFDNSFNESTIEPLYDYPALFQAKAYILKEPFTSLVKNLDTPAFPVGDLYYIQNLVAALSASP